MLEADRHWDWLKDFFSISNEFIQENKEQILSFLCEGGAEILYEYHKDYNRNVESMRRLLVAELLGRFREVKYHENDLERELSWNISLPAQKTWQENMKKKQGHFHLWEEDRFLPVHFIRFPARLQGGMGKTALLDLLALRPSLRGTGSDAADHGEPRLRAFSRDMQIRSSGSPLCKAWKIF